MTNKEQLCYMSALIDRVKVEIISYLTDSAGEIEHWTGEELEQYMYDVFINVKTNTYDQSKKELDDSHENWKKETQEFFGKYKDIEEN